MTMNYKAREIGLYVEQAQLLSEYFRIASEMKDADHVKVVFKSIREILKSVQRILISKYGRIVARHSLGAKRAPEFPNWDAATKGQIIEDLRTAILLNKFSMEILDIQIPAAAKAEKMKLKKQVREYVQTLRRFAYKAKVTLEKNGEWDAGLEGEFEEYLKGF